MYTLTGLLFACDCQFIDESVLICVYEVRFVSWHCGKTEKVKLI